MRHRLTDHIVDQDHRPGCVEAVLDRTLQPLRGGEEVRDEFARQVAQQGHVGLRDQQRMPAKQRPVVKEGEQVLALEDHDGFGVTADDCTENTRRIVDHHAGVYR
jgi:hypothetical protein